jgi:hypothetical protein
MKIQLLPLFLLLSQVVFAQTILCGKVTARVSPEELLIGATVKIIKGDEVVKGALTSFDCEYQVSLNPGEYNVEVSYTGFKTVKIDSVQVLKGQINQLDVAMEIDSTYDPNRPTNYHIEGVRVATKKDLRRTKNSNLPSKPTRKRQKYYVPPSTADSTQVPQPPIKKKKARRAANSKN